jgi:hypothetical protein
MADVETKQDLYDADFVAWADAQAMLARAGDGSRLDLANIAEELEGLSARERRELRRRLARLLQHSLKWAYQPELRSRGWATSIAVQRSDIADILADSPSLREVVPDLLAATFRRGRDWAAEETGLMHLPPTCPWTVEQSLSVSFLPDGPARDG